MKIIIVPYAPEMSGRHYCLANTLVENIDVILLYKR